MIKLVVKAKGAFYTVLPYFLKLGVKGASRRPPGKATCSSHGVRGAAAGEIKGGIKLPALASAPRGVRGGECPP